VEGGYLMLNNLKTVVTGGSGRFGINLRKVNKKNFFYPSKKDLNILNQNSIYNYLKKKKAKRLIHLAGLSRPMSIHDKNISHSIELNIIGTSNIVMVCQKLNIKLIYFSTSYVYPGGRGNYKETDPLFPFNNYGWSKLGGESAVQMYKNSLILRVSTTEKPFVHPSAFADMITNFIYHNDFIKILNKVLNKKGVLNIGGSSQSVYDFVKKHNPEIKKIYLKNNKNIQMPKNISMNLSKLKKYIK
jgi:dTDP-4-dehydrorhamnose reductase